MSGGSMNYIYSKLEYEATFTADTPERRAFARHLKLVAKALHDIEWVDSSDYGPGDENAAIRACLGDAVHSAGDGEGGAGHAAGGDRQGGGKEMSKHTPGPWHWPHDSNDLCPVNPDPQHMAVSSILTADGGFGFLGRSNADTLAELDADRRLIAAAPDLLDALKTLLFAADDSQSYDAALVSARAAIAKAEGSA